MIKKFLNLSIAIAISVLLFCGTAFAFESKIGEIKLKGLSEVREETVRDVIPFKEGDEFSFEKLDLAINYLRKWGVFNKIEARTEEAPHGVIVEIAFEMAKVISQIDIEGNYPYLENKLFKYLTLNVGDMYTPDRVEEQVERIKEFYNREGHTDTEVYVEEKDQPFDNGIAILFKIHSGHVIRYRNIEVIGNRAYPTGRFSSAINTWKPFSEKKLARAIRNLEEFYRLKGYPRVKIRVLEKKIDFDKHMVDVTLSVNEGAHVKVKFSGNEKVSSRKLRRTITIFKEGSYDDYEIEASVDSIKQLYKDYGYPDVSIKTTSASQANGDIIISFKIDEGASQIVKGISFHGNKNIGAKRLRKVMVTKERSFSHKGAYDKSVIENDSEEIVKEYSKDGFLNSKVGEWEVSKTKQGFDVNVSIPVEEGPQTIVSKINFNGNNSIRKKYLLEVLKVRRKKPINWVELPNDASKIKSYYADHGYPYAEIKQNIAIDDILHTAEISYDINEGSEVRVGNILIIGDVLTSQKAIKSAMGIKEGEPFSYRKLLESQINLRRLGAFSAVKVDTIGLAEKQTKVHVFVEVDEQRPFLLDLGISYTTDQRITGSLAFKNLNSFGWAKQTLFKLTAGRELARAEAGWLDPSFLGSSFEMSVNSWIQHAIRPAFNYLQAAGSIGFFRRYRSFGFYFRYELDRNYFIQGSSVAADSESLRNNTISKISLSSSYDTRDSFSNPKNGWFTMGGTDIFNEIRGNNANFVKFYWQGENESTFFKRFTISTALRFNRIQTIGKNVSVPTNELLFLGGDDTIRGFGEDSLGPVNANGDATGGRTRWILNEELRTLIWNNLYWAVFYDMGSLTDNFSDITWYTIRRSIGFGLRYMTPVGPIRFDYGIKLDRRASESFGRLHVTFGYVF